MKRKVHLAIGIILLLLANFIAYYYMRPSVCLLTDDIPYSYMVKMNRPRHLTTGYRSTWRTTETLERLSRYDMVIDMTLEGVGPGDNIYRMEYDAESLFLPLLESLQDGKLYILYDNDDMDESELVEKIKSSRPDAETISYDYEMDRSMFDLWEESIVDGSYLMVFNLEKAIDFIRYIDKDIVLVADYLDSTALEDGADIVAKPDWDGIIREFLSI